MKKDPLASASIFLQGSWDFVTRVIIKVTILTTAFRADFLKLPRYVQLAAIRGESSNTMCRPLILPAITRIVVGILHQEPLKP